MKKPEAVGKMSDEEVRKYIYRHHFHEIIPHIIPPTEFWMDQAELIKKFTIKPLKEEDIKRFDAAVERVDKLPINKDPETVNPFYDRCVFYYSVAKRSPNAKLSTMAPAFREMWLIVASHDEYVNKKELAILEYKMDILIKTVDLSLFLPEELLADATRKLQQEFERFEQLAGSTTYIVSDNTGHGADKISKHFKEEYLKQKTAVNLSNPIFDEIIDPRLK